MRVLLKNPTKEVLEKIPEYFPGLEITNDNYDIIIDVSDYSEAMDVIRAIRGYCPQYLQEFAEDLEEVMNETRN